MPKLAEHQSHDMRGPGGRFLPIQTPDNTSGSLDPCSDSDADTDMAWEIDSESENQAENDPDYQEDWAGLPKLRTYAEWMERNAEKRARIAAKQRSAETRSIEHRLAGPMDNQ
ncbi:hypothetical protein B0H14DRAFT_2596148 [Mycena olivaceomarginata]|nr:hypothetical protein B0H14DRAFT_2596148 [Mycena olivaceomarginata]